MVGSLHDLQHAAIYMGSAELEMCVQERIQMIEAVEQSQINQMAAIESWLMDSLSVEPSDAIYHASRSITTAGLEIGSLALGAYGAVKGVIGFVQLARAPMPISKAIQLTTQIKWPSPAKGRSVVNGIEYMTHALERMAPRGLIQSGTELVSRGIPPSVVENAINFRVKYTGNTAQEIVHTFENIRVVTNADSNKVVTVIKIGR